MKSRYFSEDIREFLFLLHRYDVKYVIVGGEAVIYHGYARVTGDLDIFYEVTDENVQRLFEALLEFWRGDIPGIKGPDEFKEEMVIQFGVPPNRFDLIGSIDGVAFQEAWGNRVIEQIHWRKKRITICYIGLDELIRNKEAMRRPRDIEDLKYLREAKKKDRGRSRR